MTKPVIIKCDECEKGFKFVGLKKQKVKRDVVRLYIECPHCGASRTSCFTNAISRRTKDTPKRKSIMDDLMRTYGADYK